MQRNQKPILNIYPMINQDEVKRIEADLITALGGDAFKERHDAFYLWTIVNKEDKVEVAYILSNPSVNRVQISYNDQWDAFEVKLSKCNNPYKPDEVGEVVVAEMPVYYYELEEVCNDLIEKHINLLAKH